MKVSKNTVERLILYRKILKNLAEEKTSNIYSHKLALLAENTSAQVRRDLMVIGYLGSPAHGYDVSRLEKAISSFLDVRSGQNAAILGLGNLGRAILDYCRQRNPNIRIVAAFDIDPLKTGMELSGCHVYPVSDMERIVREKNITVAILTLPSAEDAQTEAEILVRNGVRGILNYTPARLNLGEGIYVENRDMMMALEKAAFFAKV